MGNDDYTPHVPRKGSNTNLEGETIYINVAVGSSADLLVSFVEHGTTDYVMLPAFYMSILDIDGWEGAPAGNGGPLIQEEVVDVQGYDMMIQPAISEYAVDETVGPNTVRITAEEAGGGCDNPRNPGALGTVTCLGRTVVQERRTVSFLFRDTFQYRIKLSTTGTGPGGRNYAIAAWSALVDPCTDPTPAPTSTSAPGPVCSCDLSSLSGNDEECTSANPLYVWTGAYPDGEWNTAPDASSATFDESLTANDFAAGGVCSAYKNTGGGTCDQFCKALPGDLQCVRGMDDSHYQSTWLKANEGTRCGLLPSGHERDPVEKAGCIQTWQTQYCVCGCIAPSPITLGVCTGSTGTFKACNVGYANPEEKEDLISDPLDMTFSSSHSCVTLGLNNNKLLVSTMGCAYAVTITPEYVVQGGGKTLSFGTTDQYKFQFSLNILNAPEWNQPTQTQTYAQMFAAGKNYEVEVLANANIISTVDV